ncbi:hypothetical protein HPP92_010596 [Vanilla planifolia]|uniref:Uncharacterized protein n=1 Tax=Vanilla planifolia TaxID=51239 RepID=A0A835UZX8_VANPL|nr:hypothetical protein HPP92_010596 [Vanilla planifolia]
MVAMDCDLKSCTVLNLSSLRVPQLESNQGKTAGERDKCKKEKSSSNIKLKEREKEKYQY